MDKLKFALFVFVYIMFSPLIFIYSLVFGTIKECTNTWKLLKKIYLEK